MVFMAMSKDNSLDPVFVLFYKCKVGYNVIDARHFVTRKHNTAIHNKHLVILHEYSHILAYSAESAYGNYFYCAVIFNA